MLKRIIDRRYRLEQLLVSDDAGELHRGTDLTTGESVAIRLVAPTASDAPALAAKLQRQFQTMRQIRHPSIVQAYQFGQAFDRSHYLAMEYLPGASLSAVIAKSGPMPVDRTSRLLDQMASAIDAAHAQNLVHEALGADNVVVFVDQMGGERCKLSGFVAMDEAGAFGDFGFALAQRRQRDMYKLVGVTVHMLGGKAPADAREFGGDGAPPARLSEATRILRVPEPVQRVMVNAIQAAATGSLTSALDFAQQFREAIGERSAGLEGLVAAAGGRAAPPRRQAAPTTVIRPAARVQPSATGPAAFEPQPAVGVLGDSAVVRATAPNPMAMTPNPRAVGSTPLAATPAPTRPPSHGYISAEETPANATLRRVAQATRLAPEVTKGGLFLDWASVRIIVMAALLCALLLTMSFVFKG